MATTVRTRIRAGALTVLQAYKTANPTLLTHVYDHRPGSVRTPCAFVAKGMDESVRHDANVRSRTIRPRIIVLNRQVTNDQATDEQDVLADGLIQAFSDARSTMVSHAFTAIVGVEDGEERFGDAVYAGFAITLEVNALEGY